MIDIAELRQHARRVPSMGGTAVGPWLEDFAEAVPRDRAIVELGVWLGSATAHLALGATSSGAEIHAYDHFKATHCGFAQRQGVLLKKGEDYICMVRAWLKVFPVKIHLHQLNIRKVSWQGPKVGLYVDDACKSEDLFRHAMRTFKPWFVPGETMLVLMDYFFGQKVGRDDLKAQERYMAKDREFEFVEKPLANCCAAIFKYVG